ncbi:MAG: bifunctional diguanylate cyclase/phosphodiesterase [Lachnospiraceae bacterium]|nr:bifunctional diguanylate cyclase/phosphodiesterase [Lachnospiraceae bacterium]
MRTDIFVTLVNNLMKTDLKDNDEMTNIVDECCRALGISQIEIDDFNAHEKSVLMYKKYDNRILNEADYEDTFTLEKEDGPIGLRFWFDYEFPEASIDRGYGVQLFAAILKLNLSRFVKIVREEVSKTHDLASGILNSRGFLTAGQRILDEGRGTNFASVYLNVEKFKIVNQIYGHDAGDIILAQAAKVLSTILANLGSDHIVGRQSGDSFVCLVSKDCMDEFLETLETFSVAYNDNGKMVDISLSFYIGIYEISIRDRDMSEVMENSSTAYSLARHNGNLIPVYYDQKLRELIIREKDIESKMRSALENHEFTVYYQPKINLNDYSLIGAEALVRWLENGKVIPPDQFVPLFERNGFICNIDFFVLNSTCRALRNWLDRGMDVVPISVNFSRVHFSNSRFAQQIVETVKRYHVPPKYIEIEFTETMDVADKGKLVRAVEYLKSYGLATSMDDFGTGYSSLSLLKNLPVDVLKIDKSLLDSKTPQERIIISNVVHMVNEMNIKVITEGVETEEQAEFLKDIDCIAAQGFLFDRPLPHPDFEKRLNKGRYEKDELKLQETMEM